MRPSTSGQPKGGPSPATRLMVQPGLAAADQIGLAERIRSRRATILTAETRNHAPRACEETVMTLDVPLLRSGTPGVANVLHFNNAGAALPPRPVRDAVTCHLAREAAIGRYEPAAEAADRLADVYDAVAALIGAQPDEIAVVDNATRARDMAFYAVPFRAGDRVITARAGYLSNYLAFLQMKARAGIEIDVVDSDPSGQIDLAGLERTIGPRTMLIAITHVPGRGGLVNPAAEVGRIAARHGSIAGTSACGGDHLAGGPPSSRHKLPHSDAAASATPRSRRHSNGVSAHRGAAR